MGKAKDVRAAVEAELSFDPLVNSAGITVVNIGGHMNLTGTVPSYPQYLEAVAAARRVGRVITLDNNLEVVLPERGYRDDVKLATAANNALAANVTVPGSVEALAGDGNITLTGTVSYGTERAAAEAAVCGLAGVRNVSNEIDISYDLDPVDVGPARPAGAGPLSAGPGWQRRDGGYQGRHHHAVRPRPDWAEHDAVLAAALMAGGVIEVRDDLQVTG